jgi:exoribonuclease R
MPFASATVSLTGLAVTEQNSARDIIENFMIAANVAMAQLLEAIGVMSLRRILQIVSVLCG